MERKSRTIGKLPQQNTMGKPPGAHSEQDRTKMITQEVEIEQGEITHTAIQSAIKKLKKCFFQRNVYFSKEILDTPFSFLK